MDNEDKILHYFRTELYDLADKEESKILEEVDSIITETIREYEVEAKNEAAYVLAHNKDEINAEVSKQLAELNAEKNRQLNNKRNELCTNIFNEVKKQLIDYSKTAAYRKQMLASLKDSIAKYGLNEVSVNLKPDDTLENDLKDIKAIKEVKTTKDITLGGYILENKETGVIINESYDAKMDDQLDWFHLNSGLFIK